MHSLARIKHVAHHAVELVEASLLCEHHGALSEHVREAREQDTVRLLIIPT